MAFAIEQAGFRHETGRNGFGHGMIDALVVGELYSNEEIFSSLRVSNAGGIRVSLQDKAVLRAVIMTSVHGVHSTMENPYHDRLEAGVLTYTAAGKLGQQTLAGVNSRLIEQKIFNFPIHGFVLVASRRDRSVGPKRWKYLGLLEYIRHYPDTQLDADGKVRKVWLFEFMIHSDHAVLPLSTDAAVSGQALTASRLRAASNSDDDEIIDESCHQQTEDVERIEQVRSKLLAMEPRNFELFIKELLLHCGFSEVCVTRFSADGGVDVNARAGLRNWVFENTLVQVQAKRWLHSVGRKEVAELRGSLQPFAKGAVVTTSHFSKAAINEASELGKNPIVLVDGFRLSKVVLDEHFHLAV
ncbi:MAG TPA: restriction endonuclease [Bryobacteraceae bacterium]|nr:restriction endonuclease [Bryobacteraceae bacterium]